MNTTANNKKVSVKEEISPEQGLTEVEIKAEIWNSPPAQKGQGRYLILGKTITPADFTALKSAGKVTYWSEDFLEECDMFFTSPGWRIHADGLSILRQRGYEIEIDTIEAREKERAERLAQRKIEDERKAIAEKSAKETYHKELKEYEAWLGSPKWVDNDGEKHGEGSQIHLKSIHWAGDGQYTEYGLTPAGYIHAFQHFNSDWWDHAYSELPAPAHVVAEAQKIVAQQEVEAQKRKDAWEEVDECPRCHSIWLSGSAKYGFACDDCGHQWNVESSHSNNKEV